MLRILIILVIVIIVLVFVINVVDVFINVINVNEFRHNFWNALDTCKRLNVKIINKILYKELKMLLLNALLIIIVKILRKMSFRLRIFLIKIVILFLVYLLTKCSNSISFR